MVGVLVFVGAGLVAIVLWSFLSVVGTNGVRPPPPARPEPGPAPAAPSRLDDPAAFSGPVRYSSPSAHGFGRLEVHAGKLSMRPGPLTELLVRSAFGIGGVVIHTRRTVHVFCADHGPLPLVWQNTGILLRSTGGSAVVVVPGWDRRRLLEHLDESGFTVIRHDTSRDLGYRMLRRR